MELSTIVGIMAGSLTTISLIPQAIKVWQTKSATDLSLPMYILFTSGVFCWMTYGVMLQQLPIIIPNFIAFLLALFILSIKIVYK